MKSRMLQRVVAVSAVVGIAFAAQFGGQAASASSLQFNPVTNWAPSGPGQNETPSRWFVELASAPTADGGSLTNTKADKAAFRANANAAGLKYTERFAYDSLFNGLSVSIAPGQVSKLSSIPGVKSIYPINNEALPTPDQGGTSRTELASAIQMTGADIAQNQLGLTGKGVKVAVMDTGIDFDNPDLGGSGQATHDDSLMPHGCFGPGCRVATGWDFVGDNYDSSGTAAQQVPHPDAVPDDCAGHGTHVSGIIGANGVVKGVAPGVTFGDYRVFGCSGTTSDDVMVAAMERILADHMDVLNMSIGSAFTWPQYPTAQAADRLVNKGVVVVASIGNSGANGLWSGGAPGLGKKVIGVASFDNTKVTQQAFSITPDNKLVGYTAGTASSGPQPPPAPTSGSLPIVALPTANILGCNPIAGDMTGKAVLIKRGTCNFTVKEQNAIAAGAAAVVLYNSQTTPVTPAADGATVPVLMISLADGNTIVSRLATGPVTLTWTTQTVTSNNPTGNLISSFSSYGLSPDLALKPDIGAPGGSIWSTYPLELGGHASLSGTSMASPHVAGAVALYLQAHPHTSANSMRDILQNTASPRLWSLAPGYGLLDHTFRQGAGMLQIDKAVQATTQITPGKLSLGDTASGTPTNTLTLTNSGSSAATYNLSSEDTIATDANTYAPSFDYDNSAVNFTVNGASVSSVTVPAGGAATINVTIAPPATYANNTLYGGYLTFEQQDSGQTFRVPFAGYKGDYAALPSMSATASGYPWLARSADGIKFTQEAANAVFTLSSTDPTQTPQFVFHLDHQAQLVRAEVFNATTGESYGRVLNWDHTERNSTATSFFSFAWDGTGTRGNSSKVVAAPNGTYIVKLTVVNANGSDTNPNDVETWTSPSFTITRP